jgi:hypothetical protein
MEMQGMPPPSLRSTIARMPTVLRRLYDFIRRRDKLDVFFRQGLWCWRNAAGALTTAISHLFGRTRPPLLLAEWSNSWLIGLNRRLGFFALHGVKRAAGLDKAFIPHLRIQALRWPADLRSDDLFPPDLVDWTRRDNHFLLLDLSGESLEPGEIRADEDHLRPMQERARELQIDHARLILLTANMAGQEAYSRWQQQTGGQFEPINVLGMHGPFFYIHWRIVCNPWFRKNRKRLRSLAHLGVSEGVIRSRHFMSLNLKPRPHRFVLLLHLLERGHIAKGWVTYHAVDSDREPEHWAHVPLLDQLPSADRLRPYIAQLISRSPITLPHNPPNIREVAWIFTVRGSLDWLIPEIRIQQGAVNEILSYFEIVTETFLSGTDNLFLTEKIIRPLVRLQPFICIGPPYMLRELRRLGFKTFSPWFNEAYDEIINPAERMEAILKEIDRLLAMPISEMHKCYCDMWPIIAHNYDRFTDYSTMRQLYLDEVSRQVIAPVQEIYASRGRHG